MAPNILYTGCVLGAIGIYLLLRPGPRSLKAVGVLLGLGAMGWVFKASAEAFTGPGDRPTFFFYVFSGIAIAAAVRMITHHRPVYSALYFVMVVLSSAALCRVRGGGALVLGCGLLFAGAILLPDLFVLRLAHQAPEPVEEAAKPDYDVLPREPAAAATVGFIMLALLSDTVFLGASELRPGPVPSEVTPDNIDQVGMALIADFPVSLELAGVILLMAMYGAVVLARRQIELSEGSR